MKYFWIGEKILVMLDRDWYWNVWDKYSAKYYCLGFLTIIVWKK